jgi:preprotein translocase subunit SecB
MQNAAFSIINYQFDKVEIDLSHHKSDELSVSFDIQGVYTQEIAQYELTFSVKVGHNDEDIPFAKVQCKGIFEFENVSNLNDIPDFFYTNSIAILFPYVRAYLSLVTTQANVPGIILPTYNLSDLKDELRKNTTQK